MTPLATSWLKLEACTSCPQAPQWGVGGSVASGKSWLARGACRCPPRPSLPGPPSGSPLWLWGLGYREAAGHGAFQVLPVLPRKPGPPLPFVGSGNTIAGLAPAGLRAAA